jgi:predicted nucleic acid-binding protein
MHAVLDSNVVIGLAKGECFELLHVLFERVWISAGVRREIVEEGVGRPGCSELKSGVDVWIQERSPSARHGGETAPAMTQEDREVLDLAVELSGLLLTDDLVLKREGERLGLVVLGAVDIVALLKQRGILPAVKPVLDLMQARDYRIEPSLYNQALRLAGEAV